MLFGKDFVTSGSQWRKVATVNSEELTNWLLRGCLIWKECPFRSDKKSCGKSCEKSYGLKEKILSIMFYLTHSPLTFYFTHSMHDIHCNDVPGQCLKIPYLFITLFSLFIQPIQSQLLFVIFYAKTWKPLLPRVDTS